MNIKSVLCSLAAVTTMTLANASPVTYDIVFTRTVGSATPTGHFTYDASETFPISDFKVAHRGFTFDFTTVASFAPTPNITPVGTPALFCAAGASSFDVLAGTTGCTSNQLWLFFDGDIFDLVFSLFASQSSMQDPFNMAVNGGLTIDYPWDRIDGPDDGGTFRIVARDNDVPEPMTLSLVAIAFAGLATTRRRMGTPSVA